MLREEIGTVLAAMRYLRPRDRDLVGMRIAAGLSSGEVGRVLSISEHAATMATHRAIERLRAIAGHGHGTAPDIGPCGSWRPISRSSTARSAATAGTPSNMDWRRRLTG